MLDNAPMGDTAIADLLRAEGFRSSAALATARAALENAGLTRPGKARMADEKLDRARDAIGHALVRHCSSSDCTATVADDGRLAVEVERAHCSVCSGSNNLRALRRMGSACVAAGVRRVLVVGGRPPLYREMGRRSGTTSSSASLTAPTTCRTAPMPADCAWADLLVIWAPTPLPHKVSTLYRADVCGVAHRVTVHRRGIEALAAEVIEHLS